jgi:hypothetical protein
MNGRSRSNGNFPLTHVGTKTVSVSTADAGGPCTIPEGQSFSLSGQAPGNVASYSWDINGDRAFGDASGVTNTTVSWAQLHASGDDLLWLDDATIAAARSVQGEGVAQP